MAKLPKDYKLTEQDLVLLEQFKKQMAGEEIIEEDAGINVSLREFVATPSAQVLIPRVIVGAMRQAAEPLYIGSKMLKRVRLRNGQVMVFPYVGVMRAYDIAEGQEFPEDVIDIGAMTNTEIRVNKSGVRVRVTEEMITDSQWDIIAMLIEQAGRAMARHKEQKCFNAFSKHGHVVFDNNIRGTHPQAGTTGRAFDGTFNNTLSVEDMLDLIITVMGNEFTPTDILMHPLAWTVFAKNGLLGSFGKEPEVADGTFKLGPDSIQGRLPFAFNLSLSPFIPLDRVNKTFDFYCVDRNNIGVLLVKEDLSVDQFDEPARDIRNLKVCFQSVKLAS